MIVSSTISVSMCAWTCFFILIHRRLSSTLEEKRFVSRLTPMNTGLPLKNDRAPPVVQRMQLPCVSLYTHEYTTAKCAGVRICVYIRGTLPRSFLGNIISLGIIERRLLYRHLPYWTNVSQLRDVSSQDVIADSNFVHPLISITVASSISKAILSRLFSIIRFSLNRNLIVPQKNYRCVI